MHTKLGEVVKQQNRACRVFIDLMDAAFMCVGVMLTGDTYSAGNRERRAVLAALFIPYRGKV